MNLENEIEIDEGVEIKNDQWFRQLMPTYDRIPRFDSNFDYSVFDYSMFEYANNNACSCAAGYTDSKIDNPDFKRNMTIHINLQGFSSPCTNDMRDFECYFYLRQWDDFDLSIENIAKDGCTTCYGIGHDLWRLTEDELINTLTRSMGDNEDCTPKQGYHKSKRNEIYRCEEGDHLNGIIAFTEANGETDYECGFDLWEPWFIHGRWFDNPIILVSFFDKVNTLF